eukprot:GFUD01040810.1.p1 GENE.GFUD01040810.1~~GFUD01040810.1.p1  ORF type:complete len:537 (+),score=104.71 GFUD01040810.1:69-1613(+)
MAILSKVAMPFLSRLVRNRAVPRLVFTKYRSRPVLFNTASTSSNTFSTCPTVSMYPAGGNNDETQDPPHGLTPAGMVEFFICNLETMPVVDIMENRVLEKLMEYSTILPTPISIEEFIDRGCEGGAFTEAESYNHLKNEVAVRLAHMIMELQHLPKELHAEERCHHTISLYSDSFSQIIEFEDREPDDQALVDFMKLLVTFKARHKDTVNDMALACMTMKEKLGIPGDDVNSPLLPSIKTFLDRLYTSRISIHMITNQHLSVYGWERTPPHQIGIIHPNTSLTSILVDAYDDALMHTENCYMVAPKVNIRNFNSSKMVYTNEPAHGVLIPSHLYIIFFEVLKNAMRATVETHWERKYDLPPITAIVCQSDEDFTIKISDQGGGVSRANMDKLFFYLYSTTPQHSASDRGLGYGLPLARLYARYFHGDLRVAAYDGFGTDVYIYTRALANTAVERLPVYKKESVDAWLDEQALDWTSSVGTDMMQGPDIVHGHDVEQDTSILQPRVKPSEDHPVT